MLIYVYINKHIYEDSKSERKIRPRCVCFQHTVVVFAVLRPFLPRVLPPEPPEKPPLCASMSHLFHGTVLETSTNCAP